MGRAVQFEESQRLPAAPMIRYQARPTRIRALARCSKWPITLTSQSNSTEATTGLFQANENRMARCPPGANRRVRGLSIAAISPRIQATVSDRVHQPYRENRMSTSGGIRNHAGAMDVGSHARRFARD